MANRTGPSDIRKKWFMTQSTDSLRRRLKKYPELGDEWVKGQLDRIGKQDLYFPGVSAAIKNRAVGTESSYLGHPKHEEFRAQPGQEALAQRVAKKTGEPWAQQIATGLPWQQEFRKGLFEAGAEPIAQQLEKIGQPLPLEPQMNAILQQLAGNYRKEFGNVTGPQYFSGPGVDFVNNLPANLQSTLAGLNPVPALREGAQAANPYIQSALQKGGQLAQGGLNQAQSYLAAAQPYAKRAMGLGADIFNQIQQPALAVGKNTVQGLGNLLNMLRGG